LLGCKVCLAKRRWNSLRKYVWLMLLYTEHLLEKRVDGFDGEAFAVNRNI